MIELTRAIYLEDPPALADARVYAGFHFRFSSEDAIRMGEQVAAQVRGNLMRPRRDSD